MRAPVASRPLLLSTFAVTALLGLALLTGGVWLAVLGGSWYYLFTGIALLLTAFLLLWNPAAALSVYTIIVAGTLVWAISETRLQWWPMAARGDVIFLLGAWLLLLWRFGRGEALAGRAWRRSGLALSASLLVAAVVGLVALLTSSDPWEIT